MFLLFVWSVCLSAALKEAPDSNSDSWLLEEEIRQELLYLADYGVFDYLKFEITDGDTVILGGQAITPTLKDDAAAAVRGVEGVGTVVNNIELLPPSPSDDRIRNAAYRSIFSTGGMGRYRGRTVQSIHIIVKNGDITLFGYVASEADKDTAEIAARRVPGAFEIINNLKVK
jgi:hyperosmotically inducible protein